MQGSRPVVLQLRRSYPRACIGTSTLIIGAADLSSRRFDAAVPKLPLQRARRSSLQQRLAAGGFDPVETPWCGTRKAVLRRRRRMPTGAEPREADRDAAADRPARAKALLGLVK